MSLDQQEMNQIRDLVSNTMTGIENEREAARLARIAKRRSAKNLRRIVLVFIVLGACATTHYIVESNEVAWMAQSFELMMAAVFEALFGTVRD